MRKKIFFFAAALAALGITTQSCTNEDVLDGNNAIEASNTIKFSNPLMDGMNATRAASTTAAVMNVADQELDVIGYYANDVATEAKRGIQYVGAPNSNAPITLKYTTGWDYKNPADMSFWPGGDIYFQAVYPSTFTGVTANALGVDAKTPRLNRNVIIQSDAANQIDLVFGDAVASSGTVGLVFKHGLSKIDFNAQMLTSTMSARIQGVKIHNVYDHANVGFLGAVSGQKRELSVSGYTAPAAANSFVAGITETAVAAYNSTSNPVTNLMANGGSLIMMPQTAALMTADSKTLIPAWVPAATTGTIEIANTAASLATYFELDVYLKTQDGTELLGSYNSGTDTYTYAKVYIPFQADWAQGTSYTYTFQIGAGTGGFKEDGTPIFAPISYTVSSVTDWTDGGNTNMPQPVPVDLSMVDNAGAPRASRTTANCYMVHDAGIYKLPLVYGNAIKNGNESATTAFYTTKTENTLQRLVNHAGQGIVSPWIKDNTTDGSTPIVVDGAELIWEDQVGLVTNISVGGDYLKFEVPADASTKEGNAVIAAKMGSTIVWSWHIWVTTETYASLTTINTGDHTYQVAPTNVGEANGGSTYYQWGRKDAFPTQNDAYNSSGTKFTSFTTASSGTIADNIKNPLTWYKVSEKPHNGTKYNYWDMANTSTSDNRSDATVKTIYDPCPPDFCVPTSNLYNYMGSNSGSTTWTSDATFKGCTWTADGANLKFPAAGYRDISGGYLGGVGNFGYYWSATPYSSSVGRRLGFNDGYWSLDGDGWGSGCAVRPVLEE